MEAKYDAGGALGQGGFGSVTVVSERATGKQFACKTITKRLDIPDVSENKQKQHVDNIQREIAVLRKLRGTLNVVYLEEASSSLLPSPACS